MKKLYHYITKGNNALEKGIFSFAKNPNADLTYYFKRSGQTTHEGIIKWMENCFEGRSRGIRGFSEPIQWHDKSLSLKKFIDNADRFSINLEALEKDGLIETIYISPAIDIQDESKVQYNIDEKLVKLNSINDIDNTPIDWSICNDEKGYRFAVVPYYLIIIKDGIIPPQYITKE